MRILFVISSLQRGGAEKILAWVANHFAERGHNVSIVTWEKPGCVPEFELNAAVSRRSLDLQEDSPNPAIAVKKNIRRIRHMRRAVQSSRPDIVISFGDITNIITLLACFKSRVPVIVSERIDPHAWPKKRIWRFLRLLSYPLARSIVVQTDEAKAYFPSWLFPLVTCIPNPVPEPDQEAFASPAASRVILGIGRLVAQKRFDLLIQAFAALKDRHLDWNVLILGDGDQRPALEHLCDSLHLQGRVDFAGKAEDIRPALKSASMFILSSDFEGFPNALSEAMSHGLAVIATATSGAKAIIRDGIDGVLVPVGGLKELILAMDRFMKDSSERDRLGGRAREVSSRFSEKSVAAQWDDLVNFKARS